MNLEKQKDNLRRLMGRREVLLIGATGAVSLVGLGATIGGKVYADSASSSVTSTPALEEGPYWVDETGAAFHRSDVRANIGSTSVQAGLPLYFGLTVSQYNTTTGVVAPLPSAFVYIWSASAEGIYSDEAADNSTADTFLRGYQVTNGHGNVQFLTLYPGWYGGRTPHIHLRVRLYPNGTNGQPDPSQTPTYDFETQVFFDDAITAAVYANVSPYNTRVMGRDTYNTTDRVYQGGSLDADGVTTEAGALTQVRLADDGNHAMAQFHMVLNLSLKEMTGGGTPPTGGPGGTPPTGGPGGTPPTGGPGGTPPTGGPGGTPPTGGPGGTPPGA